MIINNEVVK